MSDTDQNETNQTGADDLRTASEEAEAKHREARGEEAAERQNAFQNEMQKFSSQMADVLGELDAAAKTAETPEIRIQALSQKLRHLELRRHHVAQVAQEEQVRSRMANDLECVVQDLSAWLKYQREDSHNPDHTVVKFRGMGLQVEARGKEDDPLFQRFAATIEEISKDVRDLRTNILEREHSEIERDNEHVRAKDRHKLGMTEA